MHFINEINVENYRMCYLLYSKGFIDQLSNLKWYDSLTKLIMLFEREQADINIPRYNGKYT